MIGRPYWIECKWRSDAFETCGLKAFFRQHYPKGRNFLISPQVSRLHTRAIDGLEVTLANVVDLGNALDEGVA